MNLSCLLNSLLKTFFLIGLGFFINCNTVSPPEPTAEFLRDEAPAWSPSGKQIAYEFINKEGEEGGDQIWKADTSGENKIQLTANSFTTNRASAWSPDSQRKVLIKPTEDQKKVVLWIINHDGSGLKQLT